METISRSVLTFLLNAGWQMPVVAAAAALACRLLRRGPAFHRHAVWTAALALSILLPLASIRTAEPEPGPRFTISFEAQPAVSGAPASAVLAAPPPPRSSPSRNVPFAQTTAGVLPAG